MSTEAHKPLADESSEKAIRTIARDLFAKPGFIRNGATEDCVLRALRLAWTKGAAAAVAKSEAKP